MARNILIIGAVALGPKAACRFKRLEPDSRVVMIDQSDLISYGGCGIPYYVSGDVSDPDQLQSTSFNMLRDERFFRDTKDIRVLTGTRALSIDRQRNWCGWNIGPPEGETQLAYDRLVLATGARPRRLSVPGEELSGVFSASGLRQAIALKQQLTGGGVGKAVIVGAGPIGLEMAEALADLWGIETTVLEIRDQILPSLLGRNLARMAQRHMEEHGVSFGLQERVLRIEGKSQVERVVTDRRTLEADLVVVAAGVTPSSELAAQAGLDLAPSGAVIVNERLQTSDPDIYAGGDLVEIPNLLTGRPGYWPLGSMANRQGRVIGTNLAGGRAVFEGAVGSFIIKLFETTVSGSGLNRETAARLGIDATAAFVAQFDRAHFYPEKDLMYLELALDRAKGTVIGIQGLSGNGDALMARISPVAALLPHCPTPADIGNLELPYSPPFAAAMDILNALGNTAENILASRNRVIDPDEFARWWEDREQGQILFLDCRERGNAGPLVEKYPDIWRNIPQGELRGRIAEVPRDKRLVLICNTGVRSYEAQVTLDRAGLHDCHNLQGGMAALKRLGLDL